MLFEVNAVYYLLSAFLILNSYLLLKCPVFRHIFLTLVSSAVNEPSDWSLIHVVTLRCHLRADLWVEGCKSCTLLSYT